MSAPAKICVVTGAASGIGRHTVETLLGHGHSVMATDVRLEALERTARDGAWPADRTLLRALDVRDAAEWERALDAVAARFGRLDVLYNVAGILRPGYVAQTEAADVDLQMDVNAKGVMHGTRAAARRMIAAGRGHIVNVASLSALAPVPGLSIYSASKHAARAFSIAAAMELRPSGVAVTVVCPDAVQTPMLDLQKDHAEAALTFSGTVLTAQQVADELVGRVLDARPIEVILPPHRGWLARTADLFPELGVRVLPLMRRLGRSRQKKMKHD